MARTTAIASESPGFHLPTTALLPFALTTFAITWGIAGFFVFTADTAVAWFGEISGRHPAFFLATWAPAIAGLLVVFRYGGIRGSIAFLSRLALWRCSIGWAAFLLIGIPVTFAVGAWAKGTLFSSFCGTTAWKPSSAPSGDCGIYPPFT